MKVVLKNVIFWSQNSRRNAAKTGSHFFKTIVLAYFKVLMNLEIKLVTQVYFQRLFGPFQETLGNRGSKKVKFFVVEDPTQIFKF